MPAHRWHNPASNPSISQLLSSLSRSILQLHYPVPPANPTNPTNPLHCPTNPAPTPRSIAPQYPASLPCIACLTGRYPRGSCHVIQLPHQPPLLSGFSTLTYPNRSLGELVRGGKGGVYSRGYGMGGSCRAAAWKSAGSSEKKPSSSSSDEKSCGCDLWKRGFSQT